MNYRRGRRVLGAFYRAWGGRRRGGSKSVGGGDYDLKTTVMGCKAKEALGGEQHRGGKEKDVGSVAHHRGSGRKTGRNRLARGR
jgi:hypothetical protein